MLKVKPDLFLFFIVKCDRKEIHCGMNYKQKEPGLGDLGKF